MSKKYLAWQGVMSIKSAILKFSNRIKSDIAEKLAHLKHTSADENASNASISSSNTNIPTGDGRTFHHFLDLPREIQSRIGVEATLANPEGLLAGLNTMRLVSHPRSNYLAAIPQLNRIEPMARELVNSVHEKMYPTDGLPEQQFTGSGEDNALHAEEHVANAVENWKFLTEKAKTKTVRDVLNISNSQIKFSCIRTFLQLGDKLEPKYRRPIVKGTIEVFKAIGASEDKSIHLKFAANAIIHLKEHVGPEELSRLNEIFLQQPYCRAVFNAQMVAIENSSHENFALSEQATDRPEDKETVTLTDLKHAIDEHMKDDSICEREKNLEVYAALSQIPGVLAGRLDRERAELADTRAAGDSTRILSGARAELLQTPRPRDDYQR